jgi:hypothetical protein
MKDDVRVSAGIAKARHAVEVAQRNAAALDLAGRAAGDELASAMLESAGDWLDALDAEREQARRAVTEALDAFDEAVRVLAGAASAAAWVRSGQADGRFDRRPGAMVVGSVAPSSRRVTANSEPLHVDALISYLRESIVEPERTASEVTVPPVNVA